MCLCSNGSYGVDPNLAFDFGHAPDAEIRVHLDYTGRRLLWWTDIPGFYTHFATFGDFEVIFETNPDWGPCSGFFMRSNEKGACYQMMIDYHDAGNVGEIYREGLDGVTNRTFNIDGLYADGDKKVLKGIVASKAKPRKEGDTVGEPMINLADWSKIWTHGKWNTVRCKVVGNPPTITTCAGLGDLVGTGLDCHHHNT